MEKRSVVTVTKFAEKQLRKLPKHIRADLFVWLEAVEETGIREVRKLPGYHDEALKGDRKGQRSVRLTRAYRAIYEEEEGEEVVLIAVLEVNKHDY
jgi:proteic killer suppression protein